ncbi:MAG: serine/threonine-protein phosphatase [Candidatus Marinimicrobia bacterium]|nr:serine/threonine-protein phosphatase [Candidatus Neomarinimicrobiota bacterium]
MQLYGKTIKGRRPGNEDSIYYEQINECFIMMVADGVGGNFGGETASRVCVAQAGKEFKKFAAFPKPEEMKTCLERIYRQSVQVMERIAVRHERLKGLSSTLALALGIGDSFVVGNIGDSRTFLVRKGQLHQISVDHSYLQEYRDKYPDEEVPESMKRQLGHIITRSVSAVSDKMDIFPVQEICFALKEGEGLLVCSDGLLLDALGQKKEYWTELLQQPLQDLVNRMIKGSLEAGSKDNISVVYGKFNLNSEVL